jgi:hypothetical protein
MRNTERHETSDDEFIGPRMDMLFGSHHIEVPLACFEGASYAFLSYMEHQTLPDVDLTCSVYNFTFGEYPYSPRAAPQIARCAHVHMDAPTQSAMDRYSELRRKIVESGITPLADDELRTEIHERKGARPGSEP